MLLQTVMGQENFPNTSAKVFAFIVPTRLHPGKELNIALAAKAEIGISKVGTAADFPCAPGFKPELGRWTRANYDLPEGTIVKIFLNKSVPFGQARVNANLLIKMRNNGPFMRVGAILTGAANATISRANFEGRFDIITPTQAMALGAAIPLHFLPTFDDTMIRRGFEVTELERETGSVTVEQVRETTNTDGEAVVIKTTTRRRMIGV